MDGFSDLRVFVAIAEGGSLSAAGRRLGLSPGAMSHRLNRIEERLGVRLVHRTTHRLTLTGEGEVYFERAAKVLADLEDLEAEVSRRSPEVRGVLRVAAPTGFAARHVVPHLRPLLERHPDLRIDLDATDRPGTQVETGRDLTIRVGRPPDSALIATKLAEGRAVLVAAPTYLARRGRPRRPEDLAGHEGLSLGPEPEWRFRDGLAGERTVRPVPSLRTDSVDVLREAAVAGLGIARAPLWDVAAEVRTGRLVTLLDGQLADDDAAIHALFPSRAHLPARVRAFIQFLRERYAGIEGLATAAFGRETRAPLVHAPGALAA